MSDHGLVSIIMPSHDSAHYIAESIESVIKQTYQNWELLIQEDGSTDNTKGVIERYAKDDKRIKCEVRSSAKGAAITRNEALQRAKGRWVAFLDSDDLWSPDKLDLQIAFMVENGYHFSYTNYSEINEKSDESGVFVSGPKHVSKLGLYAFCWPGCLTVMYERECYGLLQIADIKKNNDYAMWLQICQKLDCYLLDECLAKYRRGRVGSISTESYLTMISWHYRLWHEAMQKNVLESLFWTGMNLFFGVAKKIIYVKKINNE